MFSKVLAIAQNTFLETIRQPVYGIILIVTCFMMILNNSLSAYTLSDDDLFLRDLGLSTLLISGLFLAALSAAGVLNREIENKTVLTLISKPISRPALIIGKFAGLITALTVAFYVCTLVMLLVLRHKVMENTSDPWDMPVILFGCGAVLLTLFIAGVGNYWYGWQFTSTAVGLFTLLLTIAAILVAFISREWQFQNPFAEPPPNPMATGPQPATGFQMFCAIALVLMMVWVLTSVALATSCKLGQAPTLVICGVVLVAGLTSDYFFGQNQQLISLSLLEQPSFGAQISWLAYRIIPNLSIFWVADALTTGKLLSMSYLLNAMAYAALYITAILLLGVALFQRREVG